jgi:hypothetical protein
MTRVFDVGQLPGLPAPGQCTLLLTARADLDLTTAELARIELRRAVRGPVDAVLLDITRTYVGVTAIHLILEISQQVRGPLAVVGAPKWLVDTAPLLDLPRVPHLRTVDAAIAALRLDGRPEAAPHGGR